MVCPHLAIHPFPNIGVIVESSLEFPVDPTVDYDRLSYRRKREILMDASSNSRFMSVIRRDNRHTLQTVAKRPFGDMVNVAAVVVINSVRKLAAEAGQYDEWDKISDAVLRSYSHPRPLYTELHSFARVGIEPVVITIESPDRERVQTQHADIELIDRNIRIVEFWPKESNFRGYPAIRSIEV